MMIWGHQTGPVRETDSPSGPSAAAVSDPWRMRRAPPWAAGCRAGNFPAPAPATFDERCGCGWPRYQLSEVVVKRLVVGGCGHMVSGWWLLVVVFAFSKAKPKKSESNMFETTRKIKAERPGFRCRTKQNGHWVPRQTVGWNELLITHLFDGKPYHKSKWMLIILWFMIIISSYHHLRDQNAKPHHLILIIFGCCPSRLAPGSHPGKRHSTPSTMVNSGYTMVSNPYPSSYLYSNHPYAKGSLPTCCNWKACEWWVKWGR